MKTDYFNLIESKLNTERILEKKISNIINNQQTGGVLPLMAAKFAAKKLAKSNMAKNAMKRMGRLGKGITAKGAKENMVKGATAMKEGATAIGKKGKNAKKSAKKSYEKSQQQMEELNKIEPNSAGPAPEYPKKLQIVPRDPHVTKKLSDKFTTHIEKVKKRIDDVSTKIEAQGEYVKEEQRILDKKKEILDVRWNESAKESGKRSWEMVQGISTSVKYCVDRFMSVVRWILLLIIKFLIAIQPLIWALCAIICVFVLIMLIAWLLRGGKFKVTDSDGKDVTKESVEDDAKESCSNNYGSCGTNSEWDWNGFLKNPIKYSLQRNVNSVNTALNIPDTLNKLRVQNPIYALRKNLKLLNNDNFKTDRTPNTNQRDDSITFINYKLIDSNVANKHFSSPNTQEDYYSISLLKPKNIEWELPHLDYKDTDMDKLPESIKNYKDKNNPDDYSLNDTSKIIFPWKKSNSQWVLDCDTIFNNNEKTNLYQEGEEGYCQAKAVNARIYSQ
tara:strand:- start:10229 stop:11737 length:1509 start_codon:yes stop_codon:yes gene_type:complete